jgi:hypothetical protein
MKRGTASQLSSWSHVRDLAPAKNALRSGKEPGFSPFPPPISHWASLWNWEIHVAKLRAEQEEGLERSMRPKDQMISKIHLILLVISLACTSI